MNILLIIALSLTPALFWMWWYYRKDVYDKEPMRLLGLVFILTVPLSILCGLLEFAIDGGTEARFSEKSGLLVAVIFYVGVVGVIEESAKLFVVSTLVYRRKEFNEPMDGIIYAAASALGFATLENIFYMIDQGPYLILLRGPVSTLGHILFSGMWGAALGLAKFEENPARRRAMVLRGLLLAIVTHGVFDVLISLGVFFADQPWLSLLVLPFLALLYYIGSRQIAHALNLSDFNPRNAFQRLRESHHAIPVPFEEQRYVSNPNAYRFRGRPLDNIRPGNSTLAEPKSAENEPKD